MHSVSAASRIMFSLIFGKDFIYRSSLFIDLGTSLFDHILSSLGDSFWDSFWSLPNSTHKSFMHLYETHTINLGTQKYFKNVLNFASKVLWFEAQKHVPKSTPKSQ